MIRQGINKIFKKQNTLKKMVSEKTNLTIREQNQFTPGYIKK